jgi:hypothetical protein
MRSISTGFLGNAFFSSSRCRTAPRSVALAAAALPSPTPRAGSGEPDHSSIQPLPPPVPPISVGVRNNSGSGPPRSLFAACCRRSCHHPFPAATPCSTRRTWRQYSAPSHIVGESEAVVLVVGFSISQHQLSKGCGAILSWIPDLRLKKPVVMYV